MLLGPGKKENKEPLHLILPIEAQNKHFMLIL